MTGVQREAWTRTMQASRPAPWKARTWSELPRLWRVYAIASPLEIVAFFGLWTLTGEPWFAIVVQVLVVVVVTGYQMYRFERERFTNPPG